MNCCPLILKYCIYIHTHIKQVHLPVVWPGLSVITASLPVPFCDSVVNRTVCSWEVVPLAAWLLVVFAVVPLGVASSVLGVFGDAEVTSVVLWFVVVVWVWRATALVFMVDGGAKLEVDIEVFVVVTSSSWAWEKMVVSAANKQTNSIKSMRLHSLTTFSKAKGAKQKDLFFGWD